MRTFITMLCAVATTCLATAFAQDIPVKNGETIAFLGDSITAQGKRQGGYCRLVLDGLKRQGIDVKGVFAGISGHTPARRVCRRAAGAPRIGQLADCWDKTGFPEVSIGFIPVNHDGVSRNF